jgi:3(or 17)beta-hydroxysteroid dehydrogenase
MVKLGANTALITGGASGIGKAIATRLASQDVEVAITDIQRDLGEETAREGGFLFIEQDVRDETRWPQVIDEVEECFGQLTVLVNNAGTLGPADAVDPETARLEDWRNIFAVNVEGVFLGCRAVLPAMRRAGRGSIVNMSSVAGLVATPFGTAYGASKAAVRHLTKSVAQYCAAQNINVRCNSVHPGHVRTPLWDRSAEESARRRGISFEDFISEVEAAVPLGDLTLPEDVAAAVAFLASDASRHITGAQVVVDGGLFHCDTYRWSSS